MISPRETYLLNFREAVQTPSVSAHTYQDLTNPDLPPPPSINHSALLSLITLLPQYPELIIEYGNPVSSPTTSHHLKEIVDHAKSVGVVDRIGIHIRLAKPDIWLATHAGGTRIHTFASHRRKSLSDLKLETTQLAEYACQNGASIIRTSLEHATEAGANDITKFINITFDINHSLHTPIITAIGFPDTNGVGTPQKYSNIIQQLDQLDTNRELTFHTHLHDDRNQASNNFEYIQNRCQEIGYGLCIESTPPFYPGERNGIKPTFDQLPDARIPSIAYQVVTGATWLNNTSEFDQKPPKVNTSGVHSANPQLYSKDTRALPNPGVYEIMGKANITYGLLVMLDSQIVKKTTSDTALVARELAAQKGNLPHSALLAIANIALTNPEIITNLAESFGPPEQWLDRDPPDLSPLLDQLPPGIVN